MHRNEGENAAWTVDGKSGFRTSPPYTLMTPEWAQSVQEELMNVIEKSGLATLGQANDTRDQLYEAINGLSSVPIGCIIAWLPGYFTAGGNVGYTAVTDVDIPSNWKECTGVEVNDSQSPIFNGAGRFLPDLTDDRFLMGDVAGSAGGTGGSNTQSVTQQPTFTYPNHKHYVADWNGTSESMYFYNSAGTTKSVIQTSTTFGAAGTKHGAYISTSEDIALYSKTDGGGSCTQVNNVEISSENRPKYLSCRYIMRIR